MNNQTPVVGKIEQLTTEPQELGLSRSNALLSVNDSSVFIYAARYAHNRNTGAAMQVVNAILHLWDRFDYVDQQQLKREAKEAVFNIEDWKRLISR